MLPGRASKAYLKGLDALRLSDGGIPNFEELSARLMKLTGWQVVAVPGLVLMPLFSLREQLPEEAGLDHLLPGAMVILLASLALGALTNVAGVAFMLGQSLLRRLRSR